MDERSNPQSSAPDEGELLAAYLDAETDEVTSARVERLLREDSQAAARLDAIARTRARLQDLDGAVPPEGFRERLDARLRAEREAPDTPRARRSARTADQRFAPLAAVAALVLVAVLGVGALLTFMPRGASEEAGGGAGEAAAPAATSGNAPLAGSDSRADEREQAASAPEGEAAGEELDAGGGGLEAAVPRVSGDAEIARRLERPAQRTRDPSAREAELRARSGLPATPVCVDDVDASAVDLVERDGELLLVALVTGGDGPRVVVFDPEGCARVRTFAP